MSTGADKAEDEREDTAAIDVRESGADSGDSHTAAAPSGIAAWTKPSFRVIESASEVTGYQFQE